MAYMYKPNTRMFALARASSTHSELLLREVAPRAHVEDVPRRRVEGVVAQRLLGRQSQHVGRARETLQTRKRVTVSFSSLRRAGSKECQHGRPC